MNAPETAQPQPAQNAEHKNTLSVPPPPTRRQPITLPAIPRLRRVSRDLEAHAYEPIRAGHWKWRDGD